jgi:hypothetical protein
VFSQTKLELLKLCAGGGTGFAEWQITENRFTVAEELESVFGMASSFLSCSFTTFGSKKLGQVIRISADILYRKVDPKNS